jgi:phosphate transport system permease protein
VSAHAQDTRAGRPRTRATRRSTGAATAVLSRGEPLVWLTGGGLVLALAMIAGLLALVIWQGGVTFWQRPLVSLTTSDGATYLGEISRTERYRPAAGVMAGLRGAEADAAGAIGADNEGALTRLLLRTGNFELDGEHFRWLSDHAVVERSRPEWALLLERLTWGRFYGEPVGFLVDGELQAQDPAAAWALYRRHHDDVRDRWHERRDIERNEMGAMSRRMETARLAVRTAELKAGVDSPAWREAEAARQRTAEAADAEFTVLRERIAALNAVNDRFALRLRTASGAEKDIPLAEIVRAVPANRLGIGGRLRLYLARWGEFLSDEPREANSEGGVLPAIFGTVAMTLVMTLLVVPFGVLAALYLREYAKAGLLVSLVRISVNNLAGVPSIVFGVFGLGFFCYVLGGGIDQFLFAARLPNPTYGTGGLLWASLTLALLTLPVVIVSTEEALAAVPNSMREGSYACGAGKWQTIRRIVLPRALPGILTGAILAMARGAGEVAPLMLVGAVKLAPELPVDGVFPFIHLERSFMHLGFHIYDLGFQSQNSEAAKPMVFTTTLLLITIIAVLNLAAVRIRAQLRKRYAAGKF